jgi:signal transduction histidine kinase
MPGAAITRYVIAVAQMLWSALVIHLTGGRIETHFHVFGSLAFLAFYRDFRVLIPATVVIAADHLLRQIFWPESVFGIVAPESWRFLEHAGWVVFEDVVLVLACLRGQAEMREVAERRAEAELASARERAKSNQLDQAMTELSKSQLTLVRTEKLAAVGKLAASVGHELRNPLSAVRNAHTYISKRMQEHGGAASSDPRLMQFSAVIERELNNCTRIISDLLDFARERPPVLRPCPLRTLVDDAIGVVPQRSGVQITNCVPDGLPVPTLDKEQFRQALINLIQNAVEAVPSGKAGEVRLEAEGGADRPWVIRVVDNGAGIPPEVMPEIFQPLFTTKTKGTGLGLAITAGMVQRHNGTIKVDSTPGQGTAFTISLPPAPVAVQAAP